MIKKLTLLSVVTVLCLVLKAQNNEIKPLTVGDFLPEIELFDLINYPTKTAVVSDFKGKWCVLAFWGPTCVSCIKAIPKIDSLQAAFQKDIQFIMVTNGPSDKITGDSLKVLFDRWKLNGLPFPKIPVAGRGNEFLDELFPHEFVPHYVWINKWGKVCAITTYHLMDAQTIKSFLRYRG